MSNVIEPIVISSGEEDEIVIIKEIPGDKEMDVKSVDVSNFRLNNSKLKALKSRRSRNRLRSSTNSAIANRPCETEPVIKSSPKLLIDSKKLKKLRADLKIKLEQHPNSKLAKRVKKEEKSDDEMLPEGMFSPSKNKTIDTLYQSPCKQPPLKQINLFKYVNSPPKCNNTENAFHNLTLSPSKTPSPKTTPQKAQSTLEKWVTPTKRMRELTLSSPSYDVNSKRNELVWPPQHVVLNSEQYIGRLYKNLRDFPITYKYLVESVEDEKLFFSVVKTIDSCMSKDFAPSSEMIWYLVKHILLKSSNARLVSLTYSLLNDIIEKYPTKCIGMNITSEDMWNHFFKDKVCNYKRISKTTQLRSKLALSFLLSVLSVELKATALKSKQRRPSKHFSADFGIHHVNHVISHLKKCLEDHTAAPNSCGIGDKQDMPEETSICGLELCQNVLKLFMIVSVNKEDVAVRLADHLMYLYIDLPNLHQRVLLLQSVTSHCIRQHLTAVLLMNYCSPLPEALNGHNLPLCVRKILLQDFYRQPPKRSDGCGYSPEDIEEYITLLAYLLQSYTVVHTSSLHGYHNDYTLCNHDKVKEFSQEDISYLKDLKSYVSSLRERCVRFLSRGEDHSLSLRTNLLLYMMEVIV